MYDYHLHTSFSGDSESSPESMIESAIEKGIKELCITDHMDYDYPDTPDYFLFSPDDYFKKLQDIKFHYHDQILVKIGVELGLNPVSIPKMKILAASYPWDFIIGSSHLVYGKDPYFPTYWNTISQREGILLYWESILENLNSYSDFDVYGHLEYIIRYSVPPYTGSSVYFEYQDIIDTCLKKIILLGKGIEINSSGFRHTLARPNPNIDVIKRYRELGGEIITLGSDAHMPAHIGYRFQDILDILPDLGFSYLTTFTNRIPHFIKIK